MSYSTGCWNCKRALSSVVHDNCPVCGWLICPYCGACRFPYYGDCFASFFPRYGESIYFRRLYCSIPPEERLPLSEWSEMLNKNADIPPYSDYFREASEESDRLLEQYREYAIELRRLEEERRLAALAEEQRAEREEKQRVVREKQERLELLLQEYPIGTHVVNKKGELGTIISCWSDTSGHQYFSVKYYKYSDDKEIRIYQLPCAIDGGFIIKTS